MPFTKRNAWIEWSTSLFYSQGLSPEVGWKFNWEEHFRVGGQHHSIVKELASLGPGQDHEILGTTWPVHGQQQTSSPLLITNRRACQGKTKRFGLLLIKNWNSQELRFFEKFDMSSVDPLQERRVYKLRKYIVRMLSVSKLQQTRYLDIRGKTKFSAHFKLDQYIHGQQQSSSALWFPLPCKLNNTSYCKENFCNWYWNLL